MLGQQVPLLPGSASGQVEALVRPEHVRLTPGASPGLNTGTVLTTGFLGAHAKVQVELQDGRLLIAQLGVSDAENLSYGDLVEVVLQPVPLLAV